MKISIVIKLILSIIFLLFGFWIENLYSKKNIESGIIIDLVSILIFIWSVPYYKRKTFWFGVVFLFLYPFICYLIYKKRWVGSRCPLVLFLIAKA